MDWHRRSIRMGAAAILLAVLLRLYGTGALGSALQTLYSPELASFLVYLETGRVVRPIPEATGTPSQSTEPAVETTVQTEPAAVAVFSEADAELVHVWGTGSEQVEPKALMDSPLAWDLTGDAPTVLILHTHATESFTQTAGAEYKESSAYRTLDKGYNMVAIGVRVEQLLEAAGIQVIRSEEFYDYPNYTGAYTRSRATAEEALEQYPSIRLILDLHRDSSVNSSGKELDTSAKKDGQESAQLMLLMSVGHDDWQENMGIAVKLTAYLERTYPGITRGIMTRKTLYNQDLIPGAMLVEVGAAGNTQEEALRAADALAEAIIALSNGAERK